MIYPPYDFISYEDSTDLMVRTFDAVSQHYWEVRGKVSHEWVVVIHGNHSCGVVDISDR